jgi:hypothetical protein
MSGPPPSRSVVGRRVEDRALRLSNPTLRTGVRLTGEDLSREVGCRTHDEGFAVALRHQAPLILAVGVDGFGVPACRAVGGRSSAWLHGRAHSATVSRSGDGAHRPKDLDDRLSVRCRESVPPMARIPCASSTLLESRAPRPFPLPPLHLTQHPVASDPPRSRSGARRRRDSPGSPRTHRSGRLARVGEHEDVEQLGGELPFGLVRRALLSSRAARTHPRASAP